MGILAHRLGPALGWQRILTLRSGIGLGLSGLLLFQRGLTPKILRPGFLWVRSLCGLLVQACTFFALTRLPATDVVTLRNTSPLWIAALAASFGRERTTRGTWFGVTLGVLGVFLLESPRLASRDPATLLALGSAGVVAVNMLALSRLREVDPAQIVFHLTGVSFLGSLIVLGGAPELSPETARDPSLIFEVFLLGLSGCLCQVAMSRAYAKGPPAQVSVAGLSQVVFAATLDLLLGTRRLSSPEVLGVLLILGPGFWLTRGRPARKKRAPP